MLPKYYKIKIRNDAGVTTTVTAKWTPFRVVAGVTTYGAEVVTQNAVALSGAASDLSAAIDNTTDKHHGGHLTLTVNPGSTPAGNKTIYAFLQKSSDNTTFGSLEEQLIGSIVASATGAISACFEVPI